MAGPIRIRTLRGDDLAAVLAVWNRALTRNPMSEDRFVRIVLDDPDYRPVVARLRQASVRVFEVHTIISDIYTADWKHKLPENPHPNAATHARIAGFLLEHL